MRRSAPVRAAPNTYEAPGCQGTKISCERFFAFFSAWWIPASLAIGSVFCLDVTCGGPHVAAPHTSGGALVMSLTSAATHRAVCCDRETSRCPRTVLVKRQEKRSTLSSAGQARVRRSTRQAWTTCAVGSRLGLRESTTWRREPRILAPPGDGGVRDDTESVVRAQALPLAGQAPVGWRRRHRRCQCGATSGAATRRPVRRGPGWGSGGSGGASTVPGPRRACGHRSDSAT